MSSGPQEFVVNANGLLVRFDAAYGGPIYPLLDLHTRLFGDVCPALLTPAQPILVKDYSVAYSNVAISLSLKKWTAGGDVDDTTQSVHATFASGNLELTGLSCTSESFRPETFDPETGHADISGHCGTY